MRAATRARYNVTGAGRSASLLTVSAMWYVWITLVLTSAVCSAAPATVTEVGRQETGGVATTTRQPPRTLDRQAAELAWRSWLQSPESGNPQAPPRRITTKSLFITPLVCPKGQRLDRDGCVQVVTINKDEHERILLEQLNALFTSAPGDVLYDYDDTDPGPLQLSIPIGLEPQASPLQAEQAGQLQPQEMQLSFVKVNKKEKPGADLSIEAELELLKLQHNDNKNNTEPEQNLMNPPVLSNFLSFADKPKRDSMAVNETRAPSNQTVPDEGQKELVYGHVNVDPVLYYQDQQSNGTKVDDEPETKVSKPVELAQLEPQIQNETTTVTNTTALNNTVPALNITEKENSNVTESNTNAETHELKNDGDKNKLSPETDYSDIGEAIKLISRYAEVTTDDNFSKDQKKLLEKDDGILGTRTKPHRPNKFKPSEPFPQPIQYQAASELESNDKMVPHRLYQKGEFLRYPWGGQHSPTPPPDYPFRHLQDYWPGRNQPGGVYNAAHENPRRHHHSYNYFRPHGGYPNPNPYGSFSGAYPGPPEVFPGQHQGLHRIAPHHSDPTRLRSSNQDLYSLLGLRHWFSSEGTAKR